MFKLEDITFHKYEVSLTPVHATAKFYKTESDRKSLEKFFDLVHDNHDDSWFCRKLRYYNISVDFETFDEKIQEKYVSGGEMGASFKFKDEETYVDNFRLENLQMMRTGNTVQFSGRLQGYLYVHP